MSRRKQPPNVIQFPEPKTAPSKGEPYSYEVESGGPPPSSPRSCSRRYPLAGMEIGQHFKAPIGDWNRICCAARAVTRSKGFKFTTRKISATHIRIWRIE